MVTSAKESAPFQIVFTKPGLLMTSKLSASGGHVGRRRSRTRTTVRWQATQLKEDWLPLARAKPRALPFPPPRRASRSGDAWRLEADGRELRLSNLTKVYWPADGFTKGDLLAYYWNGAELLLPYLRDRPLTMKRMPDGLAGEPFYEKQVPAHAPDWLPTAAVPTEEDSRVVEFVTAPERGSLLHRVHPE